MKRLAAFAVGTALLAGCDDPPAGPTLRPAPTPDGPVSPAPAPAAPPVAGPAPPGVPLAAPAGALRADLPRLEPVARFKLPGRHVRAYERSVQLSADGTRVALGSDAPKDGSLTQVWRLGHKPAVVFTSPASYGGGVFALSPGGTRLLTSGTSAPEAFDVDAGKSLGEPTNARRFSHAYFRDDRVAVWTQRSHDFSNPRKRTVYVRDVVANADAGTFEVADDRFEVAYPVRAGAELWLFRTGDRFEVECYDVAAKKLARTVHPEPDAPGQPFRSAGVWQSVAPDGSAFASNVTRFRLYDGTTGKAVGGLPADVYGLPGGLDPGGGRYLARTTGNAAAGGAVGPNDLVLLDWKTGRGLAALGGFSPVPPDPPWNTAPDPRAGVSADGKTAVLVSVQGEVLVFDLSGVK